MKLTPEQQARIDRLYENESLTDNLTDGDAKALLDWAQKQIVADTDGELVTAAVRAANESGVQGAETLVAQANAMLTQELTARAMNSSANRGAAFSTLSADADSAREATTDSPAKETDANAMPPAARLQATGEAGTEQPLLTARADAKIAPASNPTAVAPKTRGKSRRRKQKKSS